MPFRRLLAALLLCVPVISPEPASSNADEPSSMRFEWVREGPADSCGSACREWVTATGPITQTTLEDFRFFGEVKSLRGATLVLDSGGGSVLASLELGRLVRSLGMTTSVGRVSKLDTAPGEDQRGRMSPRGECASMCVFVLLGGAKRIVPPEARVLVHQIWPGAKRYDASAESYTAEELVRVQRDVGRIARYTVEMGGNIELFELAMRIPPWERLRALSQNELRRVGLQTIEVAEVPTSGVTGAARPRGISAVASERGWALAEGNKDHELLRRHVLTLEGDEIGQFELSLTCAGSGRFKLGYAELRAIAGESGGARVEDVSVLLGGRRSSLSIGSSATESDVSELATYASGSVSAEFMRKLGTDPTATILVTTRTADDVRTNIKVGGAGFAEAFGKLSKACPG